MSLLLILPTKLVQGIWKANREGNQGGEHASYLKWVMFVVLVWQCAVEVQNWLVKAIDEIQANIQSTLHEYVHNMLFTLTATVCVYVASVWHR